MTKAILKNVLKVGLLLAALSIDLYRWLAIWQAKGLGWDITLMPKLFWLLALVLILSAYIRSFPVRIFYALLFAGSTLFVQTTQSAIGVNVSYFDFVTIVDARSAFEDAIAMHGPSLIVSVLPALMVFMGISIPPCPIAKWTHWPFVVLPLLAIIGLSALLYSRDGRTGGLPAPFLGLGYAVLYGVDYSFGNTGERKQVSLLRASAQPEGDIVLIVDESVSANYLDLTNPAGARSGLLDRDENWAVANFGIAASITNCSMNTNVALRYGATRGNFQRIIATGPSIWAYAKQAGMRTVYLYGQRGGANENYVSDAERIEIDESVYFEEYQPTIRDHVIAENLAERLNNDVSEFILVNKYGAHFPLIDVVPGDTSLSSVNDTITDRFLSDALEKRGGWAEYRQDYKKALEWSVGGFFDRLSAIVSQDADPFTVIYTSDHGQSFNERGGQVISTHCSKAPVMEEGVVPLVIIEPAAKAGPNWAAAVEQGKNGRSHYRIFPSLLKIMGYHQAAISSAYGPDLIADDPDPMTFGVEMYLRLGGAPRWKKIEPQCVFMPDREEKEEAC